jgi:SAM-dependent methyltransferase
MLSGRDKLKYFLAKTRYLAAVPHPFYLGQNEFESLERKYKPMGASTFCDYSHEGQAKLARARYLELRSLLARTMVSSVCEIGPGSGMILNEFINGGVKQAFAIDIEDRLYERQDGVRLILSGVHQMDIPNESVDFVYSYDALEHIPQPKNALTECLRVLRPGGLAFFKIGPSYFSPWGYHFYHILRIPYIHILFPEKMLIEHAQKIQHRIPENDLKGIAWTNQVPGTFYLGMAQELPDCARLLDLQCDFDLSQWRTICHYPAVFRAKGQAFDDFFIGGMSMLLRKETENVYHR